MNVIGILVLSLLTNSTNFLLSPRIVRQLSLLKYNQIPSPAKISQERHRKAVAAEIVEQTKNQYLIQGVFAEFTIVDCSKNEYLNEF